MEGNPLFQLVKKYAINAIDFIFFNFINLRCVKVILQDLLRPPSHANFLMYGKI